MSIPVMPAGFCPLISSYSHTAPGGVERTEIDGGPSRYALQWDRGTQTFSVTLVLSPDHFSVWNAFFFHVIKKGAISFQMQLDSGFGLQPHVCNILPGTYTATRTGGTHTAVAFQVEAESRAYDLSVRDAENLVDLHNGTNGKTRAIFDRLAIFANFDTNVLDF